jgi:hypothetical protein
MMKSGIEVGQRFASNFLSEPPDGQGWQRDYLSIGRKRSGLTSIFTLRIG